MRFFVFFLKLVTVVLRLAVVFAPLVYTYFARDTLDREFVQASHLHLWIFAWLCVLPFVLFSPEIWAATPAGCHRSGAAVRVDDADANADGRHFDFMYKGTPEYLAFHHGDPTPEVTKAHEDD